MKISKYFKYAALAVILIPGFSSCNDFFNKLPLNEIVLEKFYTEEADIRSVLTSCYATMQSTDCVRLMALWGELRSENLTDGGQLNEDISQILQENILQTSPYTKWASVYNVINLCNTVLYYAPIVQQRDPNFSESEMKEVSAQASAIRALCYFSLIRTFRDVPLVTVASIDDTQRFTVPVTKFNDVLDFLITDLEGVKNNAVNEFAKPLDNTSRFTRYGIYALLADLYLWKGTDEGYTKSIECCDNVINFKRTQYEEQLAAYGDGLDLVLYKEIPLISELYSKGSTLSGNAFTQIFGVGNSFESIFELNYAQNRSSTNALLSNYGTSQNITGTLSATPFLVEFTFSGTNRYFKRTDCRYLENFQLSTALYGISKYTTTSASFTSQLATTTTESVPAKSRRSDAYANWIFYRLTDVVLIKAQAILELSRGKSSLVQNKAFEESLKLVSAVYNRANNLLDVSADTLKFADYSTFDARQDLILLERQRELMFEGKRWFDLLRVARRENSNDIIIRNVLAKQKTSQAAIRVKLLSKDYIYFPYNESELKANKQLVQNPAFILDKNIVLN